MSIDRGKDMGQGGVGVGFKIKNWFNKVSATAASVTGGKVRVESGLIKETSLLNMHSRMFENFKPRGKKC